MLGNSNELLVPQRATTRQPDGSIGIMTVNGESKVVPKTIVVGDTYKDQYIVKSGINSGEKVIVTGYQKVQPDMQVNAKPWQSQNNQ